MIKFFTRISAIACFCAAILPSTNYLHAQTINDGCMRIRPYVIDSWLQEFEDPFADDEVALQWYAADNADLDGQNWRSDYGFLYLTGSNYIGWRTIFEGGDDQAASHPVVNLFDQTYGTTGTNTTVATPQYLRIRGSYIGDDCGSAQGCTSGILNCPTGDYDDYCYDETLTSTFNYRFSPPNQTSSYSDVFTYTHGGSPPSIGGGSNYGARIVVNWSSPIPLSISASPSTSTCVGGSIQLTANGGAVFGGTYHWYTSSGTFVGTGTTITVSPLANTTYRVYTTNGGIDGLCFKDIDIYASSAPVSGNTITPSNPVGPFCSSGNPGVITGSTPSVAFPTWSYQWETSTNGGSSWTSWGNLSSSVLPYTFDPANTTQTLLVRRIINAGGCTISSNVITYTVEQPLNNNTIGSDQTMCGAGVPIGFTGTLPTGGNGSYSYQWQTSSALGGPYSNITGANGQNYSPLSPISSTTYYMRVVAGGVCPAINSNITTVTIQPVITGNSIGSAQSFCGSGNPATLNPTGSLGGGTGAYTFQWQQSTDGGNTWTAIGGATSSTYNPPVISQTTVYRRSVYSGTCFDYSNPVTITVYPVISNNTISADQASCGTFSAATLIGTTPGGGTGSYSYTWEQSINNGITWTVIGGATAANYSPGTVSTTTLYHRIVNSLPCSDISNTVTITVTAPITVNTIGTDQTFCVSGNPGSLTGAIPTGGNGAFTYQWQSSTDGITWSNIGGANGVSYSPGVLSSTTYFHRIAYSGSCSLTSNNITITIVPAIINNSISTNQTFCGSGDPAILLGSTPSGGTGTFGYQWLSSTDNITFTPIGGATAQNYDPPSVSTTTYFRRDVTSSVCANSSNVVTITVVPVIANNSINNYQRFCGSGDPAIIVGSTPTGGTGSYNYQWEVSSNGITWSPISGAMSDSYDPPFTNTTVYYHRIVTSGVCSSTSNTSTVLILAQPVISQVTHTNLLCNGDNTGTITITGTSSNGAAHFSIDGGSLYQTSGSFSGLAAGSYSIFTTDDSSCVTQYSNNPEIVTEPNVLTHTATPQNASCDNVFDGSVTVNASGGTVPYSYSINNGPTQPGNIFSGLADGTYSILVTDDHGCTSSSSIVIDTAYAVYGSLVSQTPVSCFGGVDGTATVLLNGGVTPYSYSINGVQFVPSPTFTGLASGNYVVTLRDSKGCTDFVNVTITQPNQLQAQIDSIINIGCNGGTSGAIYISVSGGNPAYGFVWSNGATTEDITGLAAGTYNVAITDTKGCTTSVGATISQPLPLFLNVASYHDLLCYNDSTGSIDITANGGVPPYQFIWNSGATTEDIYGLLPGTYSATVTDANGCQQNITQNIVQPTQLTSSISSTPVLCAGAASGSVDLTVSGGTIPYNFVWNTGVTTEDLSNVSGGIYTVAVHDANGCSIVNSTVVTEPAPISISLIKTDVLCNGGNTGAIDITVIGGTPIINYNWSNGDVSEDVSGLTAGTYSVTITDGNGCTASASTTITQPSGLVINATPVNVACYGGANGSVDITVQGGVFPYSFAWSNSDTTEDINGLSGGTYSVTVSDFNGCSLAASFTITEPTALSTVISGTNVSCAGASNGTASVVVTGGVSPYSYLWNTFQTTQTITGISGGTYFVIVTDGNGCQKYDSIVITESPAIQLSTIVTQVLCHGASTGSIDLTATGGTGVYDYTWSNGANTEDLTGVTAGTYTVTVKDGNNCTASVAAIISEPAAMVMNSSVLNVGCAGGANGEVDISVQGGIFPYTYLWTTGATTEDVQGLSGGTYSVTITDANACTITASFVLTEPSAITSSITGTDVTCYGANNGSADLQVGGGTTPYSFLWSTFQGSEDISGISGGLYYVIITDANSCERKDSVIINEPLPLLLTTAVTNITCFNANDGIIDLSVTGGTPGYSYVWSNSDTTQDLSGLNGNLYVVTVTDAHNCTATTSATLVNPSPIITNFVVKNPLCNGDTSGRVTTIVSGGAPPYTFGWSNGATTQHLINVGAGTYTVTVTDSRNCQHIDSATVSEPPFIFTSGVVKNVSCAGLSDGFIDITAYGGSLPYSYNWSTGQSTEDIFNISGNSYYVTVTDANGCQAVSLYIIKEPLPLSSNMVKTDVLCHGAATGTLAVVPTGGSKPYTYLWNTFDTDSLLLGVVAGHYVVQLTDSNGCFKYDSIDVLQPTAISITAQLTDAVCYGAATAIIDVTTTGGTPSYTFNWSNSTGTEDLNGVVAGTYTLTVTDANICEQTASFTVGEGVQIIPNLGTFNPICSGGTSGSITSITTGGVQPYSYAWSNGGTTISVGNLPSGTYTLTVTDALSCTVSASATLNNPAPISVTAAVNGAKCFNTATGTVTTSVTGGSAPYTYLLNGIGMASDTNFITFNNLTPGDYLVIVTDVNGCQGTVNFNVASPGEIFVDLEVTEQVILTGMHTQLTATATSSTPILNYFWYPDSLAYPLYDFTGCTDPQNCSNPLVSPRTTTTFTVMVMNQDSCYASDTLTVEVLNQPSAFIPSAFTPNNDGLNDRFEFDILGTTNIQTAIFDRWGQRIYYNPAQANGISNQNGWDGKVNGKSAPFDTYVYQLKVTYFDNVVKDFTGTVTLMK